MIHYYDRQGKELGLFEWAALMGDLAYRIVAENYDLGGWCVRTLWQGLDHNIMAAFAAPSVPITFESVVWAPKDARAEDREWASEMPMWRYPTEAAALAGHEQLVAEVAKRAGPAVPSETEAEK